MPRRRPPAAGILVGSLMLVSACGDGGPGATPTPTPTPEPTSSISWSVPGGTGEGFPIEVASEQTIGATAQWAESEADVDLYITDGGCEDLVALVYGRCDVRAGATGLDDRPEKASVRLSAGSYRVWIVNTGNKGDATVAGTVDLRVTP